VRLTHLKISRIIDPCAYIEHPRWIRLQILAVAMSIALTPLAHAMQRASPNSEEAEVEALMDRVGPPSQEAVDEFKKAGMEGVRPHTLTATERTKVQAVLASLPSLNRHVLEKKLHYLAFVDGIPGEGTGLTSPVAKTGLDDITLRASILDELLSNFLTMKERREFREDGSGITVTVKGTGTDALTYVLLHESTHVMDFACGITKKSHSPAVAGIWVNQKKMVPRLASSVAATTYFSGGHPLGFAQAATVYDALSQTPFVSLYATASPREDFAELVAWHEILGQHHGDLVIEVDDANGKNLGRWEPLTFPEVQKRFAAVDKLLASERTCSGLWQFRGGA
jgi:hypothetical protein